MEDENHAIIQGDWHFNSDQGSYTNLTYSFGNRVGPYGARAVRDSVADYFQTAEGRVPWQDKYAYIS